MLSLKAKEKLKSVSDYDVCKCDYIIDAWEENNMLFIQRANHSGNPERLLKDLKPMKFKL